MGLGNANTALIAMAMRNAGVRNAVVTLGKQTFWPSKPFLRTVLESSGLGLSAEDVFSAVGPRRDGSAFLKLLGARHVDEIDISDYEGASIVHDMNQPVPAHYRQRYDLVYDGGSLEHIFDVRQALQNISDMLAPGGIYVGTTCGNNMLGHGFYQFSPELFYRLLCPENGWASTAVFLTEHQRDPPTFWFVDDPMKKGDRIQIQNRSQLNLLVVAVKTGHPPSLKVPLQSDYVAAWANHSHDNGNSACQPVSRAVSVAKKLLLLMGAGRLRRLLPQQRLFHGLRQPGVYPLSLQKFLQYSIPH